MVRSSIRMNLDPSRGSENSAQNDATGVTLDLDLPSVELKGPEISNGGTTKGFKLFNNAPDHKDGVTLNGEAPKASLDTDISGGEMEAELPSIKDNLPSVKGPNQIEVSTPSITADLKTPSLEVETKKGKKNKKGKKQKDNGVLDIKGGVPDPKIETPLIKD